MESLLEIAVIVNIELFCGLKEWFHLFLGWTESEIYVTVEVRNPFILQSRSGSSAKWGDLWEAIWTMLEWIDVCL